MHESVNFYTSNYLIEVGEEMDISNAEARVDFGALSTGKSVRHVRPSSVRIRELLNGLSWNFMTGCFTELCRYILIFGKFAQK
jgi:hypothetical protein